jgi:hypothetical protein
MGYLRLTLGSRDAVLKRERASADTLNWPLAASSLDRMIVTLGGEMDHPLMCVFPSHRGPLC